MFNLADYETVAMLNKWFVDNYPMGRTNIEITYHDPEKGYITCRAEVYRDVNDPHPATTNIAHGVRDLYNSNMRRFYAEDIASSCLGRAITLLKGGQTATRDDMEKVAPKSFKEKLEEKITVEVADDPWTSKTIDPAAPAGDAVALVKEALGGKTQEDIPNCSHGEMIWKHGVSTKSKKPWGQFRCKMQASAGTPGVTYCEPIWYEINEAGTWQPQKKWA